MMYVRVCACVTQTLCHTLGKVKTGAPGASQTSQSGSLYMYKFPIQASQSPN